MSVGKDIYEGSAKAGSVIADIQAIFGTIIALILITLGIYLVFFKPPKRTMQIQGKIEAIMNNNNKCDSYMVYNRNNSQLLYKCLLSISYTIPGQPPATKLITTDSSTPYVVNDNITLYYDPNNIQDIDIYSDDYRTIGWVLFGIGVFIIVFSWIWAWLTHRYKVLGVLQTASTATGFFRSPSYYY